MLRINQYPWYDLGWKLHQFADEKIEDKPFKEVFLSLWSARASLEGLLSDQFVPLRVSRPVALKVVSKITDIIPVDIQAALNVDRESKINWAQSYHLQEAVKEFETVLAAELPTMDSYFVSQKASYSTPDLIEHAENIIPEPSRKKLTEQTIIDLRQAGRCIAFDIPTAAAFHMFRATESVIRTYYQLIIGTQPKQKSRNWGTYIKKLRQCGKADANILGLLELVKDSYRNPILHPEVNLDPEEAQVIIGACVSLIVQMERALP